MRMLLWRTWPEISFESGMWIVRETHRIRPTLASRRANDTRFSCKTKHTRDISDRPQLRPLSIHKLIIFSFRFWFRLFSFFDYVLSVAAVVEMRRKFSIFGYFVIYFYVCIWIVVCVCECLQMRTWIIGDWRILRFFCRCKTENFPFEMIRIGVRVLRRIRFQFSFKNRFEYFMNEMLLSLSFVDRTLFISVAFLHKLWWIDFNSFDFAFRFFGTNSRIVEIFHFVGDCNLSCIFDDEKFNCIGKHNSTRDAMLCWSSLNRIFA